MQFPIDILYIDKGCKVLKTARNVKPFKIVMAPFRAYYALELPVGAIANSSTRVGDHVRFEEEEMAVPEEEDIRVSA
jgi:uncharacterized membrane protein (UPF0127 family)